MRIKTSLTLSAELLKAIGRAARTGENRSQTVERLVREGLTARARHESDAHELAQINKHADTLNAEAADVLSYQVEW
jgi:metal-responsive CopG/Arc/MetJ family transcriptional regulator